MATHYRVNDVSYRSNCKIAPGDVVMSGASVAHHLLLSTWLIFVTVLPMFRESTALLSSVILNPSRYIRAGRQCMSLQAI